MRSKVKVKWTPEEFLAQLDGAMDVQINKIGQSIENYSKINSPVKTGKLQTSITHVVESEEFSKTAYIGSDVEYAFWVEQGTRKMAPRNYLKNALYDNIDLIIEIAKGIQPKK